MVERSTKVSRQLKHIQYLIMCFLCETILITKEMEPENKKKLPFFSGRDWEKRAETGTRQDGTSDRPHFGIS
jgi:hypothetical protein